MSSKNKKTLILTSIVILLPILIGILLWNKLPDLICTLFTGHPVRRVFLCVTVMSIS